MSWLGRGWVMEGGEWRGGGHSGWEEEEEEEEEVVEARWCRLMAEDETRNKGRVTKVNIRKTSQWSRDWRLRWVKGTEGGGRNEIRGGEEGNLLMHYSARTQTAGRALSEVLRSHTHTHTHTHTHSHRHKRPRRQNERIVWALKPQTKHWERTHMLPLTQRYTHARSLARPPTQTQSETRLFTHLIPREVWTHCRCALLSRFPDFMVSILHSPSDHIPLAYRKEATTRYLNAWEHITFVSTEAAVEIFAFSRNQVVSDVIV